MGSLAKREEKSNRFKFLGSLAVTGGLTVLAGSWVLFLGLPVSGYLGYKWFAHRKEYGMRF